MKKNKKVGDMDKKDINLFYNSYEPKVDCYTEEKGVYINNIIARWTKVI